MKVIQIFRSPRKGGYSIESVFARLERPLQSLGVDVERYVLSSGESMRAQIAGVRRLKADVYHVTGHCNYVVAGLPSERTLLTVHDIGHYTLTMKGLRRQLYGLWWWRIPLRRVGYISTISHFTAGELQKHFGVAESRIRVIHNSAPEGFEPPPGNEFHHPPRILQVGSGPNKNLEGLVAAVKGINCTLVLVNELHYGYRELLEKSGVRYEQHQHVREEQMRELYQSCDIVFFASHFEGFGLPIIEGQSCGKPVVTSNRASMPEIAGDSALIVDPADIDAIRTALQSLIHDPLRRQELVAKGFRNIRRFDPMTIAAQYRDLYEHICIKAGSRINTP